MVLKKPIPQKVPIKPPSAFDHSVGYSPNSNYNVFDKTTQNVYSNQYTTGDDGFINFAGGVRMEADGIAQNDIDGLSKFYADSANQRNLFHEKQYDSINEAKRVKEQDVSWGNWEGMGNSDRLSLFNKMYGNSAISGYNMLDGSELRGNGDGGKLSAINVSLDNLGGVQTSFDPRDSEKFYGALNKGAIFGSQFKENTPQPTSSPKPSIFSNFASKQMNQSPKPPASFGGLRSIGMGGGQQKGVASIQPMPSVGTQSPKRNLIPKPLVPKYKMM